MITVTTQKKILKNIHSLNNIASECKNRSDKMLETLNKLRVMNGKKTVSSFEEHRRLKALGL